MGQTMNQTMRPPTMSGKRILYGVNGLVAGFGALFSFTLTVLGTYPSQNTKPTSLGFAGQGLLGRVLDYFTYFTLWSNILVAIVMLMLFARPNRDSFWFRAFRLDSVLMIVVTGIVYSVLLAATTTNQGLEVWTNFFLHVLTPILTFVVWLIAGPRGWISWRIIAASLIVPIIWLVFVLVRGAFIGAYPYGFLDVATYGFGTVLTNAAGIVACAIVLSLILWAIDWIIGRVGKQRSAS